MTLAAGRLDRRISLHRYAMVDDGYGDQVAGYVPIGTVHAWVRPTPGSERIASAQLSATSPMVFRIRYSPRVADLNPKDRVEYPAASGKFFDIASAVEIGRREAIEIVAVGAA